MKIYEKKLIFYKFSLSSSAIKKHQKLTQKPEKSLDFSNPCDTFTIYKTQLKLPRTAISANTLDSEMSLDIFNPCGNFYKIRPTHNAFVISLLTQLRPYLCHLHKENQESMRKRKIP